MVGLILKDFINLRKNVKVMATFIIIYGAMSYASQDSSFFGTVFTILCTIMTLNLYAFDENAKWDGYALTMPVSRDNMVQAKYLMMLLLTAIGIALGIFFTLLLYYTAGVGNPLSGAKSCIIGAGVAILFYCICIPLITKLGVEKAKFMLIAIYMVPFTAVILLGKAAESGSFTVPRDLITLGKYLWNNIYLVMTGVLAVALGISYTISINIYRKKEF